MGLLDGVKVVDTTRLLPGGYCTMLLSDLGAEVVKVEQPGLGDYMRATPPTVRGRSPVHETVNRNKLSVGVDLKRREGKEVLRRLVSGADVFVEGFRPGVMARLGFSYADVRKVNGRIVYCSISTFGRESGFSSAPAHDINFEAMAGNLSYSKRPAPPMLQLGDLVSGTFAALGIASALASKKRPVLVDVPIVQSLLSWMIIPASSYLATGDSPREGSSLVFGSDPYYGVYETKDGKHVAVAAIEEQFWESLLKGLGLGPLGQKRFGSRAERAEVKREMRRAFSSKTRDEWTRLLFRSDTTVSPVLDLKEALTSDWARASRMLVDVPGAGRVLNSALRTVPKARSRPFTRAPALGRDTSRVLRSVGYSETEVRRLKRLGAIE